MDSVSLYQQLLTRDSRFDGRFLSGLAAAGRYCLPSCATPPAPFEQLGFFRNEAQARKAGLQPCEYCRPDLFYQGTPFDEQRYEAVLQSLHSDAPGARMAELARQVGLTQQRLDQLCRRHGHLPAAALLLRYRLEWAQRRLMQVAAPIETVAAAAGFADGAAFQHDFLQAFALAPQAYRDLPAGSQFCLSLPADYRATEVLAYLGRDGDGPAERLRGNSVTKAVLLHGRPVRLCMRIEAETAHCEVLGEVAPDMMVAAHHMALRCLGLAERPTLPDGQARTADAKRLLAIRPGLCLPLSGTVFEALVWAIVGQQVNLTFAAKLRRVVIELAGREAGDGMLAHPDIAAVAALDPAVLHGRQFSRSKAEYLVGTARYLLEHGWDMEALSRQSAPAMLRRLTAIRGIGPWTAQYTLMRGAGFGDCVPVGDAGLVLALQRFFALPQRPDAEQTLQLMEGFAPWRSLATAHLWASLQEAA
ncbi:helix-turn-helix domain-containing protein [Chitinimonas arctica]|uniref:DNA-3-methyladenine glycosylase II n=1 Tax=Chitinimonas arctica TaxID=2594795 RepID=A0A516SF64_9NEIS|nr:Ada metal-binding domain-containing protein [Chitinimonas arctica]QDQ26805.1 helix-turn-helix domain-containing protein [Chitinimonas arctica]